ncbi:hypothetical protein [Ammoniphilus sp. CFH 90114]|uniref:hypothetical protein n=1 Tax=Ammoniphilus sp. CFH 90114 TaxID=2493665 RepID=UPI00100FBF3E|nr:hypothetical protein [Ammoniphilus sp. CFH 90114]RXT15321.1 hypothetical protein EIZ39_03710 [Ammoniphilus sp. CFH 90114]
MENTAKNEIEIYRKMLEDRLEEAKELAKRYEDDPFYYGLHEGRKFAYRKVLKDLEDLGTMLKEHMPLVVSKGKI